ncbi:methylcrotonoyl-CoA carboxylase subunit alpha, mitochondrial isoform X1 [Lampetra fluviatilis]
MSAQAMFSSLWRGWPRRNAIPSRALYSSSPHSGRIDSVLVANRGEIACRVIRSARAMGVRSVAVFSDPDATAMHVAMADEAHHIGPAASQLSYLNMDRILEVARHSGAQAVHPGYGFLSESAEFAERCQAAGVVFVGPPASAIRDMGFKSTSKAIMEAAGVPIIKGYHGDDQSEGRLRKEAELIGYPVMVKAVRGGGGKGMRIVRSDAEFEEQLGAARREAMKSFNNDDVIIERYVDNPRHVEVQVFADHHGNAVYLFERDCSLQRRHQKVIEEAPAPGLSEEVRRELGEAAVRAAKAVNYVGAGTVEFVMDAAQRFFFMEMNTRLQVEHPVTELITGTDLVEWQLRVAGGERLPLSQAALRVRGHAVEGRVYAEDPSRGFLPVSGRLHFLSPAPAPGGHVRVDTGVRQGDEVTSHYDPMIAKVVAWGEDRDTALGRLHHALSQYHVVGVETNVPFLLSLAAHPAFRAGLVDTGFIERHQHSLAMATTATTATTTAATTTATTATTTAAVCRAALAVILREKRETQRFRDASHDSVSPFAGSCGHRLNSQQTRRLSLRHGETDVQVDVNYNTDGSYTMQIGEQTHRVSGELLGEEVMRCRVDGVVCQPHLVFHGDSVHLLDTAGCVSVSVPVPHFVSAAAAPTATAGAIAPMTGTIEKVMVKVGDVVQTGDPLIIMNAMKMEHTIRAPRGGRVKAVLFAEGTQAARHATLVRFHEDAEGTGDAAPPPQA